MMRNSRCILNLLIATVLMGYCFDSSVHADMKNDRALFEEALASNDSAKAMRVGKRIFVELESLYYNNVGLGAFKSRMVAAEFLTKKMNSDLKKAQAKAMLGLVRSDEVLDVSVPLAKTYFESAKTIFSRPISIPGLNKAEKQFLVKYYNLRLKELVGALAQRGHGLSIALPDFRGSHDYVLVLPLLHCLNGEQVDMSILPDWMKNDENIKLFSKSCLEHYGLPYQAMVLLKKMADNSEAEFSEYDFYIMTSKDIKEEMPDIAVECLEKALEDPKGKKSEISLRFDMVDIWIDCENFPLAASHAKSLLGICGEDERYPDAVWKYYYALSRSNNTGAILADIDQAIDDSRCKDYHAKLVYIKWWSLRRSKASDEQIMAIEHILLEEYSDSPIVAPIMLSKATDLLARQNYTEALGILDKIVKKFPGTSASKQASKMQKKLSKTLRL